MRTAAQTTGCRKRGFRRLSRPRRRSIVSSGRPSDASTWISVSRGRNRRRRRASHPAAAPVPVPSRVQSRSQRPPRRHSVRFQVLLRRARAVRTRRKGSWLLDRVPGSRVPLQNVAATRDLRVHEVVHAARWYSLITPPSTLRRRAGMSGGTTAGSSWPGGRCCRDWCGR